MKKFVNYIELHNITKTYNNEVVLTVDNYIVPLDGLVAIIGFSGNGKTTLLNIISLLDTPDDTPEAKIIYSIDKKIYEVTFEKNKIKILKDNISVDINFFRRELLSFVFQENMLHPSLSPKSNVLMPLKASSHDYNASLEELFNDIGLNQGSSKSGGQKQRTAILRALIKKSKIIFADEPTSSLDMPRAKQAIETLSRTNTIWVTHDMLLAKKFAKYIIVVDKGKVCKLLENNESLDIISHLENGCKTKKDEKVLNQVQVYDSQKSSFQSKASFIFEYAKNDLLKPAKDFTILLLITVFSFLSILLMSKIEHSLDMIIKENLNDPRVSYIKIVQYSGFQKFNEEDFQQLKNALNSHPQLQGKCEVSKLKGYPLIKFKKDDGSYTNMSLGTFEQNNKMFLKMLENNEFSDNVIDINKQVLENNPRWIEDNLNFAIIGKEAQLQHIIKDQNTTLLGESTQSISLIYANNKLPNNYELFVRDEFFASLFYGQTPEDFSIMFYPDSIQTSLTLIEWLKEAKINHTIIDKKFYISDETDKYNSLKLIITIEKIIDVIMEVILFIIIALLAIVAYFNISNNIKQKHKELGLMLAFGTSKKYFYAFYTAKSLLLISISILVTVISFSLIESTLLNPYLENELFHNILSMTQTVSNEISSLNFPLLKQLYIYFVGSMAILILFIISLTQVINKIPSKLLKD